MEITDNNDINELKSENNEKPQKSRNVLLNILEFFEMFAFIMLTVLFIFTFVFRLCNVNGTSMNNTLSDGQKLITTDLFYTPKQGDIIVFHQTGSLNEPVVKRVIATGGQTVKIDYSDKEKMHVYVDGEEYADENAYYDPSRTLHQPDYGFDPLTKIFEATVPEGHVFVLGDNRKNSLDSRSLAIQFVDVRRIMGRCIMK